MARIKLDSGAAFLYPMPMVLVGAMVAGKANFMAVAWVSRVNAKPPMFAVALGRHHTNQGIDDNRQFSINIPNIALMEKTDFCGLVSGAKRDKSQIFELFYGQLDKAPLIAECPVCMACEVVQTVMLPADTLYIGEPKEIYSEEKYLTNGQLDIRKIQPFMLTMPDNGYWSVGERIGAAWSAGKALK